MTVVYPVYLIPDDPGYIVNVPDIGYMTEGYDLAEAISMARDLVGTMCIDFEDEGKPIPKPGTVEYVPEDGTIKTLVDVDLTAYRRSLDNKMVKKNCTIPNYLAVAAEHANINFSKVLQEAIAQKLGMTQAGKMG